MLATSWLLGWIRFTFLEGMANATFQEKTKQTNKKLCRTSDVMARKTWFGR